MAQTVQGEWTKTELMEVAQRQKSIIWMILISIASIVAAKSVPVAPLVAGIIQIYFIYKLAVAVRSSIPWAYIILSLFPLLGLIGLLVVNTTATSLLKAYGIKVGLMGARMADFDKLPTA